jgi:hypothetical protein
MCTPYVGLSGESFGDDIKSKSPTYDDLESLLLRNLSVQLLNMCLLMMNCNDVSMQNLSWNIVS